MDIKKVFSEVTDMLPHKYLSLWTKFFIGLILFFVVFPTYAQQINVSGLSAETMLIRINEQVPSLMKMVTAIAYVLGMYFIIHGVMKLKHVGEMRTMVSQEHGMMGVAVALTLVMVAQLHK